MGFKDTFFSRNLSINCKGSLVDLSIPKLMAILNLTPDSFFDGGKYNHKDALSARIDTIISEGADIIDIGAESSRPGSDPVDAHNEIERIKSVMGLITEESSEKQMNVNLKQTVDILKYLKRDMSVREVALQTSTSTTTVMKVKKTASKLELF